MNLEKVIKKISNDYNRDLDLVKKVVKSQRNFIKGIAHPSKTEEEVNELTLERVSLMYDRQRVHNQYVKQEQALKEQYSDDLKKLNLKESKFLNRVVRGDGYES